MLSTSSSSSSSSTDLPSDLYTPLKTTSYVWQHFRNSQTNKDYAWCSLPGCARSRRRVSRKGGTSGLSDHLRIAHSESSPSSSSSSTSISVTNGRHASHSQGQGQFRASSELVRVRVREIALSSQPTSTSLVSPHPSFLSGIVLWRLHSCVSRHDRITVNWSCYSGDRYRDTRS